MRQNLLGFPLSCWRHGGGCVLVSLKSAAAAATLQAELLLDLRVCADPNSMFDCGDTCQTIARGCVGQSQCSQPYKRHKVQST